MKKITIGWAVTGSFCTLEKILKVMQSVKDQGYEIVPIFSFNVANLDTRYYTAKEFRDKVIDITGREPVDTLQLAEPLGPSGIIDVMVIAPCTGNTLSKLANAITDTPVLMSVKSHLRNHKPVVLAISTNDGLGLNMKNISTLMAAKNVYFVPFEQDNYEKKPNSLVAHMELVEPTIKQSLIGKQIQPLFTKNTNDIKG